MDYSTPKYTECAVCGAPIILLMAEKSGKVNAIDREPVARGAIAIIANRAVYETSSTPIPATYERYMTHFATCENPDALRAMLAQRTRENDNHARNSWE